MLTLRNPLPPDILTSIEAARNEYFETVRMEHITNDQYRLTPPQDPTREQRYAAWVSARQHKAQAYIKYMAALRSAYE